MVKAWQVKILVALASLIISLVVVELGLRLLGIQYPLFYEYDPYLGNALRPGVKGYCTNEGRGYVSINSDGLRDLEHPVSHPANTLKIAVLGDSYAEAMQVNQDEAFWAILGRDLQGCESLKGRKVEVINFGVSGFGTTQELLILKHRVWKYSPDVVLLAFTIANDIADNSKTLKQVDYYPYYIYEGGQLSLEDGQSRANWEANQRTLWKRLNLDILNNLRILQVIKHAEFQWGQRRLVQEAKQTGVVSVKGEEFGIDQAYFLPPTTAEWQDAWRVTEGVLEKMADEVARHGARLFVVTVSSGVQVNPNVANRAAFAKWLGVKDLYYGERRLEKFCRSHAIPMLALAPIFADYTSQHQVYLHGFGEKPGQGHWNRDGHRLAGHHIAQWLCPLLP
jgi:hypothetical protein